MIRDHRPTICAMLYYTLAPECVSLHGWRKFQRFLLGCPHYVVSYLTGKILNEKMIPTTSMFILVMHSGNDH